MRCSRRRGDPNDDKEVFFFCTTVCTEQMQRTELARNAAELTTPSQKVTTVTILSIAMLLSFIGAALFAMKLVIDAEEQQAERERV